MTSARVRLAAHAQTWRPYTTAYPALLAVAGASVATPHPLAWRVGVAAAGLAAGWLGGHYLGDVIDRELDAIEKPQRPIPSGRLTPREAIVSAWICFAVLTAAGAVLNWRAGLVALAIIGGIAVYSGHAKARGFAGNLTRGSLSASAVLYGSFAVTAWPTWPVAVAMVVFCAHDTGSNLVGTLRDEVGDRAGGCRTVPVRRGPRFAVALAASCYALGMAIAIPMPWLVGGDGRDYWPMLLLCGLLGGLAFGTLLPVRRLGPRQALHSHSVLVVERLILAGGFLTLHSRLTTVLAVLALAVGVSILLLGTMRIRHENGDHSAESAESAESRFG